MKARRLLRRALRSAAADPSAGELNVIPFLDILTNLVLFLLATSASVVAVSEVRAELPTFGPGHAPALELSVVLTETGGVMSTRTAHLGPDCRERALATPTAARTPRGYDFAALTRCARRMHDLHPEVTSVVLSADPNVPYDDFVRAMDAVRADGDVLLFPDVHVSAGVR
jgi:biopolymer transport protein TolR